MARRTARAAATSTAAVELVDLASALGRTLAEPLAAVTDLPGFDTSAMDGWAVAGPGPWRVCGQVLAGEAAPSVLAVGSAVGIATGAQVPSGATGVLRREDGRMDAGLLHGVVTPGQDVRPRGQECRGGEVLLPRGTRISPAVLGLAAAAGHDRLAVHRRPTVELLLLGDELLESGVPVPGRVRDALGPLLPPWLAAVGAEVTERHRIGDDAALLRRAIRRATADVVVTTGGTAAGPADFLHAALADVGGRLLVDGVAVRPGHPMLLAELPGSRHLVGLPGNPLAAAAGVLTLAVPLLEALSGRAGRADDSDDSDDDERAPVRPKHRERAAAELPGHPTDTRLVPVVRSSSGGVVAQPFDGPAMLRGLALADAVAVVPPGGVAAGGAVELLATP